MNKKKISKESILKATISYCAKHGFENITTKKVADYLDISEGSILNNFNNKETLLKSCLFYIDYKLDIKLNNVYTSLMSKKDQIKIMWVTYFKFFLDNKGYAKYYRTFRQSSFYDREMMDIQRSKYDSLNEIMEKNYISNKINSEIFWVYLIDSTISFVVDIEQWGFSVKDYDIEVYYDILFNGFGQYIKEF